MSRVIIHHKGVFNIWCTVADAPLFKSGLTREQVPGALERLGEPTFDAETRITRAEWKGTSGRLSRNLEEEISANRAGPEETFMPLNEVISKYLTVSN